jgi:plastocyanin
MAVGIIGGALATPLHVAVGQSLLDRPDNISGDWVGNTGTVYFNFTHRFSESPAPERKVSNFPTFLIAAGIASRALVGVNYATNSLLVPRYPNEYELFARYAPIQQDEGAAFDLGGQLDYNVSVQGVDGELSLARREGPVRLIAVGRFVADTAKGGKTRFAFGGGTTIRLNRFIALAGDAATLTSRGTGEQVAWSAGLHIALPNTPHTLSIHTSNANTATLQGLSRGGDTRRYGFEFTVPVTLSRFFGNPSADAAAAAPPAAADHAAPTKSATAVPDTSAAAPAPTAAPTAVPERANAPTAAPAAVPPPKNAPTAAAAAKPVPVEAPPPVARRAAAQEPAAAKSVNARLKGQAFIPGRIEVAAGGTVTWKNLDQMIHTVGAADKSFTSPIIGTDASWSHTFTKPGSYAVYCTLHPFMKATVIVK